MHTIRVMSARKERGSRENSFYVNVSSNKIHNIGKKYVTDQNIKWSDAEQAPYRQLRKN